MIDFIVDPSGIIWGVFVPEDPVADLVENLRALSIRRFVSTALERLSEAAESGRVSVSVGSSFDLYLPEAIEALGDIPGCRLVVVNDVIYLAFEDAVVGGKEHRQYLREMS